MSTDNIDTTTAEQPEKRTASAIKRDRLLAASPLPRLAVSTDEAAIMVNLSVSQLERMIRRGEFPKPRKLSEQRVGILTSEIEHWLISRPISDCLPPPDSGYGRAGKPGKLKASAAAQAATC